jgi:hypothetical protein
MISLRDSSTAPDLRVINLDGVVNRACYESLVARRNIDYILEEKIDYASDGENTGTPRLGRP